MTAKYFAILTNQGAARLANAAALGTKLNLTQMAVGDANGVLPTPDPAQTKLINQKRIAPLNLLTVDPANISQIIAEQIIPENEGGFWIREIGLYDDAGVLIAVANCPETYKPQLQERSHADHSHDSDCVEHVGYHPENRPVSRAGNAPVCRR